MKPAIFLSLTCFVAIIAAAPCNEQSILEGGDLEGCNVQQCDSSCKNDGHVAGVCTFAGCQCLELDLTTIEVLSEILKDDPTEGEVLTTRECSKFFKQACDLGCNKYFKKGVCKDGKCTCVPRTVMQAEESPSRELGHDDLVIDTRACVPGLQRACDAACRRIGKKGDCRDGRCRCARRTGMQAEESSSSELGNDDLVIDTRACVPKLQKACDTACRMIGKKSDCRDGRCNCVRRTTMEAMESNMEDQSLGDKCTRREENQCNSWCKSSGHAYGVCTFAGCTCIDGKDTTTVSHTLQRVELDLDAKLQCSPERCDRSCHKFPGECVNGRCVCG